MRKKDNDWYKPMSAQYKLVDDRMPLKSFAAIEATLHLLHIIDPNGDPFKAHAIFQQYQIIGTEECTPMDHILQQSWYMLRRYWAKKSWQDDLREYMDPKYDAFRAFSFEERDGKDCFSKAKETYPYSYEERKEEWEEFWPESYEYSKALSYAGNGTYSYSYPKINADDREKVQVTFDEDYEQPEQPFIPEKGCREPITVSLNGLLETAKEMKDICENDPSYGVLNETVLKQVSGISVKPCTELNIDKVVNIVGMVGTGKSILSKVLALWCHKHGKRITIVVDTVAEVLNLQHYLSSFGVAVSPLIGRAERMKYINQVAQPDKTVLPAEFSQYLTPVCLLDGMDTDRREAIPYGNEPCYYLRKGKTYYLCPYFDKCPSTKMLRECYTSSVVLTTVAGFAATRVGQQKETFLELVMRDMDLVIFDECDRAQKTLDEFFMPETSFDKFVKESSFECQEFMEMGSQQREENPARQTYGEKQLQSATVLSCVVKSVRHEMDSWDKIKEGDSFSALVLLDNLYRDESEYGIPEAVYRDIYDLIDMKDDKQINKSTLWMALKTSCYDSRNDELFKQMYETWRDEVIDVFPRPKDEKVKDIQDNRNKLILRLIYFDHYIRELSDAYQNSHEASYAQNELFEFLHGRFLRQQQFLPSALCGNLFGLKKTDKEDIILFRQYAFGRSLMKDLSYLRTDERGNPTGPHVMMLSGSSWAEGSYEYHVNRPVNYILEADEDKRAFLENSEFKFLDYTERVSGSMDKSDKNLRKLTENSVDVIIREYEKKAGKILLIVNSYAQTKIVQDKLVEVLRKKECNARVCRLVSDTAGDEDEHNIVRRIDVGRFAKMDEDILIAPAMAIERGHNIVDEEGHSAIGSVFFMVRPLPNPDDLKQKGSKLNGYIESLLKGVKGTSIYEHNVGVRQKATKKWVKMNTTVMK